MRNLFKIAVRNLMRYKRRTSLTVSLISIGVVFVLVFISVSGSFKNMMIGQITDSLVGHIQVHRKGYLAAIENMPLDLNLKFSEFKQLENTLSKQSEIEAYSPRIKLGGMLSNFVATSNISLIAVYPDMEFKTLPLLPSKIINGAKKFNRGEIIIPELLATGMNVKVGDVVVVVATNNDGSVNGKQFKVAGIVERLFGPSGRNGYMHIEDAAELLRMEEIEVNEVAIRLKNFDMLNPMNQKLEKLLSEELSRQGKPLFEIHTWEKLTPFYTIARMIDVMTFFIKLMLTAIVLISIMNVMIMAVYERIREIGTIAAIGTLPGKILSMFIIEGLCLGVAGVAIGNIMGMLIIFIINSLRFTFNFGMQTGLLLSAKIHPADLFSISVTVIIVSITASLEPAFKASKMEPIKALRHI